MYAHVAKLTSSGDCSDSPIQAIDDVIFTWSIWCSVVDKLNYPRKSAGTGHGHWLFIIQQTNKKVLVVELHNRYKC
jgi:hypothetical protein